jgi:hypothetical protein
LIAKRRDEEEAHREAAHTKARYAIRRANQRSENRMEWIAHHDRAGQTHQALADEHFEAAAQLRREGMQWQ